MEFIEASRIIAHNNISIHICPDQKCRDENNGTIGSQQILHHRLNWNCENIFFYSLSVFFYVIINFTSITVTVRCSQLGWLDGVQSAESLLSIWPIFALVRSKNSLRIYIRDSQFKCVLCKCAEDACVSCNAARGFFPLVEIKYCKYNRKLS